MRSELITAQKISEMLAKQALNVARMLLPGGTEKGNTWVIGNVNGADGDSLTVTVSGEHAGQWRDWADQSQRGDLIDLWAAKKGLCLPDAIREAKRFLGLSEVSPVRKKAYREPPEKELKALSPEGAALKWFKEQRQILPETVAKFRISAEDKRLVFPCHGPNGRLMNRAYRPLDKKDFEQDKGCAPTLFGWQALSQQAFKDRRVVICEGQIDAMTWNQWGFDCLSVPNGAGNFNWIEQEWENLEAFDTIYVSMDMDEAGQEAADKLCERLGVERCLLVQLPHKDANDCLLAGCTAEDAAKWLRLAKPKRIDDLVAASEFRPQVHDLFFKREELEKRNFAPLLLRGHNGAIIFRPGAITAWTGHAGHGKTTLLGYLAAGDIGLRDSRYFFASMEMKPEKVIYKMATAVIGSSPSPQAVDEFVDSIGDKLFFANVLGFIQEESLFKMMRYCCLRYGINAAVIDSFMAVEGLEEDHPAQSRFFSQLCKFAQENDIHIHIICHPRKGEEAAAPGMMDTKGSSIMYNRPDLIVSVQRNMEKAQMEEAGVPLEKLSEVPDTFVYCRKCRETGWKGRVDLFYSWKTNSFKKFAVPVRLPEPARQPYSDQEPT